MTNLNPEAIVNPQPHVVRRGDGMPLLMIHGNGADHQVMLELDEIFGASGDWARIYIDLPGFGRTPALNNQGGLQELADWLDEWTDEQLGQQPFAVVAFSMGGLLARSLVARRPDQTLGMALIAPVVHANHTERRLVPFTVLESDPELLDALDLDISMWFRELAITHTRDVWERYERAALPGQFLMDQIANQRLSNGYFLTHQPDPLLATLNFPKLILAGEYDHIVGHEDQAELATSLPNCTFGLIKNAGHMVHIDQPEAIRPYLAEWAKAVLAG